MRRALVLAAAFAALVLSGCGDSESAQSAVSQPLRVTNGQFFDAEFPPPNGGPLIEPPDGLRTSTVPAGFTGKVVSGLTGTGSYAIAMALPQLGRGYWVVPVSGVDQDTKKLAWRATCDFAREIPAGSQSLQLAAIDRDGRFGVPVTISLKMLPFIPTGHVVASLVWGNDADLDLHITGPSGKELDPKHPSTGELGSDLKPAANAGVLDHDSNANCVADGYRAENVVWTDDPDTTEVEAPEPGTYTVRIDMFNSCGRPATDFTFDLYVDGVAVPEQHRVGRLLDVNADSGGPGSGLFVTEFNF